MQVHFKKRRRGKETKKRRYRKMDKATKRHPDWQRKRKTEKESWNKILREKDTKRTKDSTTLC